MDERSNPPRRWIERDELLRLVERDVAIVGKETPREVFMREPGLLIPVSDPSLEPLELDTYQGRYERWLSGDGPQLTGMPDLMATLESLSEPACIAFVRGLTTGYMIMLDGSWSRVIACVAIDPPLS